MASSEMKPIFKETVMVRKLVAVGLVGMLLLAAFFGSGGFDPASSQAAAAAERHPRIRSAIRELKGAKRELEEGAKVFGGHRVKAVKAVEEAVEQLQKALDYADK
jgi:hypothetical protein